MYNNIDISQVNNKTQITERMYSGFSSVNTNSENFKLYDFELIKQDFINQFHIRKGERLMNPAFGTVIWDLLYEQLTPQLKNIILMDVETIINYDPRLQVNNVLISQYESGLQIQCDLVYLTYNISQQLQLTFDQNNGLTFS